MRREIIIFLLWLCAIVACFFWLWPQWKDAWEALHDVPIEAPSPQTKAAQDTATWDAQRAYEGYTLITKRYNSTITLVDMAGNVVHSWQLPVADILADDPSRKGHKAKLYVSKALLYPNGDVLVQLLLNGVTPYGYKIVRLDKNSKLVWQYGEHAHHDMYISKEDGRIYGLIHEFTTRELPGLERLPKKILNDSVVILSDDGKELDRISIIDAFANTRYDSLLRVRVKRPWDLLHTNSVVALEGELAKAFPQFRAGSVLVSMRSISTIAVIDPVLRKVVWARSGPWRAQHSASFVDGGEILLFDNLGSGGNKARILQINPDMRRIRWQYPPDHTKGFYSTHFGRVQRLPNGNTLITKSLMASIVEVTPEGETVWSYKSKRKRRGKQVIMSGVRYGLQDVAFLPSR